MARTGSERPAKAGSRAPGRAGKAGARAGRAGRAGKAAAVAGRAGRGGATSPADGHGWMRAVLALVLGVLALRLGVNALEQVPVHFDEAQYWAYGQELAWGYFSKPPGVAALIRATTDLAGNTLFGLRLASPLAHAAIGWMVFLTARRLFDARTGFWAAAGYTAAPGVTASAMIASTDPPMMLAWAVALYAMVRAGALEGRAARPWWGLVGIALGLGFLAKYTILAFAAGAVGYGLVSARGRDWGGALIAAALALVVAAPNILWNAANGFATLAHVAEDAAPGGSAPVNPGALAEFAGAQLGVIGPVFFVAILAALWHRRRLTGDPGLALMAWMTYPLLIGMLALALYSRAQPNWAAPAYVAGSILAAHWLLALDWRRALVWGQAGLGAVAALALYGLAGLYATEAERLPRLADPFKKMRLSDPFCERALGVMAEEGVEVLLSDSRRRLSECMFLGTLGWDRVAIWNPDRLVDNHHELVATLQPGDARPMLLAVLGDPGDIPARFAEAREIESDSFVTHAGRAFPYSLWVVEGFRGYDWRY